MIFFFFSWPIQGHFWLVTELGSLGRKSWWRLVYGTHWEVLWKAIPVQGKAMKIGLGRRRIWGVMPSQWTPQPSPLGVLKWDCLPELSWVGMRAPEIGVFLSPSWPVISVNRKCYRELSYLWQRKLSKKVEGLGLSVNCTPATGNKSFILKGRFGSHITHSLQYTKLY